MGWFEFRKCLVSKVFTFGYGSQVRSISLQLIVGFLQSTSRIEISLYGMCEKATAVAKIRKLFIMEAYP